MTDTPSLATFSTRLGRTLKVHLDDRTPVDLRIERAEDLGTGDGAVFSVTITGPETPSLSQGTYPCVTDDGETLDLFLVPVGRDGGRIEYEALFNRQPA